MDEYKQHDLTDSIRKEGNTEEKKESVNTTELTCKAPSCRECVEELD
jgi:hypothetical protein